MNMFQTTTMAELAGDRDVTWTNTFVINRRAKYEKFAAALIRISKGKAGEWFDWDVQEYPAILNTAIRVKVTGSGSKVAKVIQYFAACGFPS